MKHTHIDWCHLVPVHWQECLFKHCVNIYNGRDYKDIESSEGVPVIGSGGPFACCTETMYNGEVIFLGRKGTIDKPLYYNGPFWAVDTMFYAIPQKGYVARYLYYLATCFPFKKISTQTALPSMTQAALRGLKLFMPPFEEQKAIAEYLDKKTAEIDSQISLLENKQKAYEKLKCSLIDKVVTCGLNPAVALKDSGIDWIGEIPVHWEVKRLKSIFSECKEISSTGNEDLLSVSEYYGVARRLDVMDEDEYDTRADSLVGYKICKKDDLVINIMLAWKRGLGFSDYDGIVSPAYAVYRGKNIVPHYYHYLLRTNKYIAEFKRNSKGIIDSRLRLYSDRFFAINTIVPPLEEQLAVADYLDKKTAEIDECISLTDKKIKAYKRLKQSLIDEVVTGKRKI